MLLLVKLESRTNAKTLQNKTPRNKYKNCYNLKRKIKISNNNKICQWVKIHTLDIFSYTKIILLLKNFLNALFFSGDSENRRIFLFYN